MTASETLALRNIKMDIRTATIDDLETLLEFEQALISYERPLDPTLKKDEKIYYYDLPALIESKESQVFVVELDGEIVGCGFGKIEENKPKFIEKHRGYIGLIYVDENYRRRGIAEKIFENLFEWFKERDVWEAMLRVYHDNDAAVKAYEKIGFSTGLIEMKMNFRETDK